MYQNIVYALLAVLLVCCVACSTHATVVRVSPKKPCHSLRHVKYVRLSKKHPLLEIAEVQIYDENGLNMAPLYGTPRQSSTWNNDKMHNGPQIAVNGNTSGLIHKGELARTDGKDKNPFWEFSLPRNVAVTKVIVFLRDRDHFPNPNHDFHPRNNMHLKLELLCPDRKCLWDTVLTYWQPKFEYRIQ